MFSSSYKLKNKLILLKFVFFPFVVEISFLFVRFVRNVFETTRVPYENLCYMDINVFMLDY